RFLKRPEVIQAITEQLSKLPPGDEVAIMAMNLAQDEEHSQRIWLAQFTNQPADIAAALARVPGFVEKPELVAAEVQKTKKEDDSQKSSGKVTISAGTSDPATPNESSNPNS